MSEITGILPQKHDKTRCNIEVDGRFFCGMKLETVMQNRLKVGSVVTGEELAAMQLESEKATALDKALTHITASMKTEREIRTFLEKKGYLKDVCDFVVERMREYGFIDDEQYARQYCAGASKRKGARLIAVELKRKGVEDSVIESVVSEIDDGEESAYRLLEKFLKGKELDRGTIQKAYRHLLSKGYDYDTAKSALERLKGFDED